MKVITRERLGAGSLLTRPDVLVTRKKLLDDGIIGHIQLMMIPMERSEFQRAVGPVEQLQGKIRIHAPHHSQQVNPCAPELYLSGNRKTTRAYIEQAMNQTFEAADRTGSKIIVLHAGRYLPGDRENAVHTFHDFLDQYPDERYILENLPDLKTTPPFLGTSPDELRTISDGKIQGYCIDFSHLWCSSLSQEVPYEKILSDMSTLPLKFSHLSGTPGPLEDRQHLLLDDPDNGFKLDRIRPFLTDHTDLEISLEFPHDDPAIIRAQIEIVSDL